MENRETIAGIPITDLKKLAIKYIGNDDFSNQQLIALKINYTYKFKKITKTAQN